MVLFSKEDIGSGNSEKLTAAVNQVAPDSTGSLVQINCKASELVKELFGEVKPGNFIEFMTAGEFSMHQLLQYLLSVSGPANVYFSTWTIKEEPARVLHQLKQSGKIKALYAVFDYRIKTLDAKHFHFVEGFLTGFTLTKCHAKVMVIEGERRQMVVSSSANLSNNPRIEAGYIAVNTVSANFHKEWIMASINGKKVY